MNRLICKSFGIEYNEKLPKGTPDAYKWMFESGKGRNIEFITTLAEAVGLALKSEPSVFYRKVCLVSELLDTSVITSLVHRGWEVHKYQLDLTCELDREVFLEQMNDINPYLIIASDYNGEDTFRDVREELEEWKDNGGLLIEDVTHSLKLLEDELTADYIVGDIRSWFPVSDGAFCISGSELEKKSIRPQKDIFSELSREVSLYVNRIQLGEKIPFSALEMAEGELKDYENGNDLISEMSAESLDKLRKVPIDKVFESHRDNADFLAERLIQVPGLHVSKPGDGIAPLYLCVGADYCDALYLHLRKDGILAVRPKESDILMIPVDFRYTKEDMYRVYESIVGFRIKDYDLRVFKKEEYEEV